MNGRFGGSAPRRPDRFKSSQQVKRVINRDAILLSHLILSIIVFVDTLFSRSLSSSMKIGVYGVVLSIAIMGIARYKNLFKINRRPVVHLIFYQLVIGLAIIFFAKVGSVYPFIWLILLFLTNFYYGRHASMVSLLVLIMVIELQLYWSLLQHGVPTKNEFIAAFSQVGIISAISFFFVDSQEVFEHNRKAITTAMGRAQIERQRLTSLINNMTDGVIATRRDGTVTLYNAAALILLDLNGNVQDKQITELLKVVDASGEMVDVLELARHHDTFLQTRDYRLRYDDGELINLALNISPIKLGYRQRAEQGYIFTFHDITKEKSLEEERDEFISVVSHELRTPVAITEANISNVKFLMSQPKIKPEVLTDSIEAAHRQVLFLASMLNDLSTLSRAERGVLELNPEPVDIRDVVQSLYKDYAPEAESKGLKMSVSVQPKTPKLLSTNRLYMREVLQNFITNSIKYTKTGSVTVTAAYKKGGVLFKVSDTGIGISKSDQKKVFDKFFRSEDFRTRESSGTGLGLYVTMKLARLLRAEISVKSTLDVGSTFSIFIPDTPPQKK